MKRRYGISLDVDLVARVDAARGLVSRTAYIEQALREKLDRPGPSQPGAPGTAPNTTRRAPRRTAKDIKPIPKGGKR